MSSGQTGFSFLKEMCGPSCDAIIRTNDFRRWEARVAGNGTWALGLGGTELALMSRCGGKGVSGGRKPQAPDTPLFSRSSLRPGPTAEK